MPLSAALEPAAEESLGEYGQRLRVSVVARAHTLDNERRRLNQDLEALRTRASDSSR